MMRSTITIQFKNNKATIHFEDNSFKILGNNYLLYCSLDEILSRVWKNGVPVIHSGHGKDNAKVALIRARTKPGESGFTEAVVRYLKSVFGHASIKFISDSSELRNRKNELRKIIRQIAWEAELTKILPHINAAIESTNSGQAEELIADLSK